MTDNELNELSGQLTPDEPKPQANDIAAQLPERSAKSVETTPSYSTLQLIAQIYKILGIIGLVLGLMLLLEGTRELPLAIPLGVSGIITLGIGFVLAVLRDIAISTYYLRRLKNRT